MSEQWKLCFDGFYSVSNFGRIRRESPANHATVGRILNTGATKNGYPIAALRVNGLRIHKLVHQIVAEAFHGPRPPGMQVNHKDGKKTNNRADNLEWVTAGENMKHAYEHGLIVPNPLRGTACSWSKLDPESVNQIRIDAKSGATVSGQARKYGVHRKAIRNIIARRSWRHVA